ncbi:hydantoinase B/oxoprolinase family protein [Variovorax sp. E3]|uniref:hydantoinase B/oxoprolinase family protein n=1 Tax=Variovorax sp. E3 TaxID=1914993 RepID=UPI0018DAFED9|nr:hydantoinase B/oxoprolinase family protein [Variovorax sp. E3]
MNVTHSEAITAEIVRNYLETVSGEMSHVVESTSISPIFSEAHDYSTGIFYLDERGVSLVARAQSLPTHIFAALRSVEIALQIYQGDINEGDVFFVTDPYYGGSHIPDWTIVKPVFVEGKPMFFTSVRGHVNDVGGCAPGGYNTIAREIWQEGFRVPPVKLRDRGEPVKDILGLILANTRVQHEITGDIEAMMGGCAIGARRIEDVLRKYGPQAVCKSVRYILDYTERMLRAEIQKWPDGTYHATSILDHDFAGGGEVPVHATVTVKGDGLIVDFTGTAGQVPGFVNSVAANTISNIFATLVSLCPDIPVNSGYFRPVEVVLPPKSVVNCEAPAPVGHSTVCIGGDIGEAVMKAFEHITPDLVSSATVDIANVRVYGTNTRTGRFFVASDLWATPMSAGGSKSTDGWGGYAATFCALKLPSLEMYERQFPWTYVSVEYAKDTAAPGLHRGAPAMHYLRRMEADVKAIVYSMGYDHPVQAISEAPAELGTTSS